MLACIPSATLYGVDGRPVSVEVHVSAGLPGFTIVGLPDAAVRESRDRVRAALLSSHLSWPSRRVTVNLAPSRYRFGKPTDSRPRREWRLPLLPSLPGGRPQTGGCAHTIYTPRGDPPFFDVGLGFGIHLGPPVPEDAVHRSRGVPARMACSS
jgi:Subunit ChlI of Mg-chelatase